MCAGRSTNWTTNCTHYGGTAPVQLMRNLDCWRVACAVEAVQALRHLPSNAIVQISKGISQTPCHVMKTAIWPMYKKWRFIASPHRKLLGFHQELKYSYLFLIYQPSSWVLLSILLLRVYREFFSSVEGRWNVLCLGHNCALFAASPQHCRALYPLLANMLLLSKKKLIPLWSYRNGLIVHLGGLELSHSCLLLH